MTPARRGIVVRVVLQRALKLIQRQWVRGDYRRVCKTTGKMGYCAAGAVRACVQKGSGLRGDALAALANNVRHARCISGDESAVIDYNDATGRRKKHVVRLFQRTIKALGAAS